VRFFPESEQKVKKKEEDRNTKPAEAPERTRQRTNKFDSVSQGQGDGDIPVDSKEQPSAQCKTMPDKSTTTPEPSIQWS